MLFLKRFDISQFFSIHKKSMKELLIRTASLDEMDFPLTLAEKEGWNPGLKDSLPFYKTDPNGFFIGEIDGEKVGCISAVAYNAHYGFMGFYIVLPQHRSKGYGIQLWKHAVEYMGDRCIGLDGVLEQQDNYKKSNFNFHNRNIRFKGFGKKRAHTSLVPLNQVPMETLLSFDREVYGFERRTFLENWLQMSNSYGLARFQDEELKGYGIIRECVEGFKVGPLFTEDAEVATEIYHGLSAKAVNKPVFLDVPETNPEAVYLAKSFKLEKVFETARMYTSLPPKQKQHQVFGVTSFELG